jgi:hypothetical protein
MPPRTRETLGKYLQLRFQYLQLRGIRRYSKLIGNGSS